MKILVVPGNTINAKSYPFWEEFYELAKSHEVKKIEGILPEQQIIDEINSCDVWISIDSFIQHLVAYHKLKPGIVIWGKSDPKIFGYPSNANLLKSRKHLRSQQFMWWANPDGSWKEPSNPSSFVSPEEVLKTIESFVKL